MGDKLIMYSGLDEPSARPRVGLERPAGLANTIESSGTPFTPKQVEHIMLLPLIKSCHH